MKELIEALQIFLKYRNETYPTNCCHDVLCIMGVGKNEPSAEDQKRLGELGFKWNSEYDCWASFHFGSA